MQAFELNVLMVSDPLLPSSEPPQAGASGILPTRHKRFIGRDAIDLLFLDWFSSPNSCLIHISSMLIAN